MFLIFVCCFNREQMMWNKRAPLGAITDSGWHPVNIRHLPTDPDSIPVCCSSSTWTMWGPLGLIWGDPWTVETRTPLCGEGLILSLCDRAAKLPTPHLNIPIFPTKGTRHDVPRSGGYPHRLVQRLEWVWTDGGTLVTSEEGVPHPGSFSPHLPWTLAGRLHWDPHPWSWGQQCR